MREVRLAEYLFVQKERSRRLYVRIIQTLKKCLIMNIFQKIREVKLPFLAVIGALVFGGIVAPASAAVPTITTSMGALSATDAYMGYSTSTGAGSTCKLVLRLASSPALTAAEVVAKTALGTDDIFFDSRLAPGSFGAFPSASGLTGATNYTFYVACTDGTLVSSLATQNFTTSSPPTRITFDSNRPSGVTASVSGMPIMNPATNNGGQLQNMMMGQSPFLSGYTFGGWQTTPTGGTLYAITSTVPNSTDITLYAKWTAIGGPSQPQQQAPTTAAVQRPLPQINFAANPVNGVSARPTADTRKGTLTIEGSNLSDLTSITIGGKAATFTVKDGKLDIKLPAGVTGFPEVVMTNASGSITMQNAIEIYAPTVQKLTRFVGERLTLAGMEALENLYIDNKTATALEATVVVAPDATEAEIAKAVKAATKAVTYIDKVGKRIVRTAVTVSKTGEAGTKPSIEMSFTK